MAASTELKKALKKAGAKNVKAGNDWEGAMAVDAEALVGVKAEIKKLKVTEDELAGSLLDRMEDHKRKALKVTFSDGSVHNITRVQATKVHILWDKLRKRIGAGLWNKITIRVPDSKLLEAHIANGDIDATIVAECSEETSNKPFVKVT